MTNPTHRWTLDNNDLTDSGTGAPDDGGTDLLLKGGASWLPDGAGVELDGTTDYLEPSGGELAFAATSGFTYSAWVRYDTQEEDDAVLLGLYASNYQDPSNYQDLIFLSTFEGKTTRRAKFGIKNDNTSKTFTTVATAPADGFFPETTGSWAHIAATATLGGEMTLWRDGATRDDGAWTKGDGGAANPNSTAYTVAALGRFDGGDANYFAGAFRDVRIYDRALTPAELAALASAGANPDGAIISWGYNQNDQVSDTPFSTDYIAIAGGGYHSLALTSDGNIFSWGRDLDHQVANTPSADDGPFIAITGGGYHSLALTTNGIIISWGKDNKGQVSGTPGGAGVNFIAIAAGQFHSLALRDDGSIESWGDNSEGQVSNTPSANDVYFIAIAAGEYHSLALSVDGIIFSWGDNSEYQVTDTPSDSEGLVHCYCCGTIPQSSPKRQWNYKKLGGQLRGSSN